MGDHHQLNHPQVRLVGSNTSLFCTRVEWGLKLKGVDFEYIEENVKNKSDLLLKLNPVHKKIPVLLHGGTPVCESLVILEYIDEVWNDEAHPRLLPSDPYAKAQARFWAKFIDEKIVMGAWRAGVAQGEEKEKAIEAAMESFVMVEEQIKGKKFFGGEQIGYLDLVAGVFTLWVSVVEEVGGMKLLDPERFPSLHKWTRNFIEIPLIKESLPPRERLVNYMGGSVTYIRSLAANKS